MHHMIASLNHRTDASPKELALERMMHRRNDWEAAVHEAKRLVKIGRLTDAHVAAVDEKKREYAAARKIWEAEANIDRKPTDDLENEIRKVSVELEIVGQAIAERGETKTRSELRGRLTRKLEKLLASRPTPPAELEEGATPEEVSSETAVTHENLTAALGELARDLA